MKYQTAALVPLLILYSSFMLAQEEIKSASYVAKAGDVFISEKEFVSRYEMLPAFGRSEKANVEFNKAEFLYTLIAEKLLMQEALDRKFDRDTVFLQALMTIRKKLSRDELYKTEITRKVTLTDIEIIRGIARAPKLLFTSYLYFPNKNDAQFVRKSFKKPGDFELLKIDSSITYLRDTATVIWGDADPKLEEAVYKLKDNEISPVIEVGSGYYIAKVMRTETNNYFASMQPRALKDRVVDIIRLRKERERLDDYIAEFMKDKTGYAVPKTFILFAKTLKDVYTKQKKGEGALFSSEIMNEIRKKCAHALNDSLAVVGKSCWTLGEVISKLTNKTIPFESADTVRIADILNTQIKILVQQELLEQEALRRGLDQTPPVQERLEIWRSAMLASRMKEHVRNSVVVADSEIFSLLKNNEPLTKLPRVQVRIIKTSSLEELNNAMNAIEDGMEFSDAAMHWSIDSATRANGGLSPSFPVNEHPPIGELAWRMDIGQTYGPILYEGGYVLFKVENKTHIAETDTAFLNRYQNAKGNLLNLKRKRTLDILLSQSGAGRGVTIYEERFKNIKVTTLPMMTFRILGFGGRMFEVPFVDKQLDWLDVEPPKTKILP